jgi:serine/threonine-protein kinase RsbW
VAASTLVGGALVVLVAMASVAAAWLVWDRAEAKAHVEDEHAAQTAREALENSLGRVLTTLRGADGLVDERGAVDPVSFRAFAQAVASIPATGSVALEEVVTDEERARFEASTGVRITEFARAGVFRPAGDRPMYLPIVDVWPPTSGNRRVLGLDLLSEPARRSTVTLARVTGQASFTELIPLAGGQQGLLAFKPLYAPETRSATPIAYISASFSTSVISDVLGALPPDLRVRVTVDGAQVFETAGASGSGAVRPLDLGGRRWVVTAQGPDASHTAAIAILVGGLGLAGLLAAFTGSRASFERRLVRASDAERDARERSELLERHAAHLGAAVTVEDVAAATVADLAAAGIEIAAVQSLRGDRAEVLAAAGLPQDELARIEPSTLDADTLAAHAMRTGEIVEVTTAAEYDDRYPGTAEARERRGVESVIAVPLRNTDGAVTGALLAASREPRALGRGIRLLVTGVAEQCGVALERAKLQTADREARHHADILQHLAAGLSAAALTAEVAEAAAPCLLEGFDADACLVGITSGHDLRLLSVVREPDETERRRWSTPPLSVRTPASEAVARRAAVEAHGQAEIAALYDNASEHDLASEGLASMLVVPLQGMAGAIGIGFRQARILSKAERELLETIGNELAKALERATLFEREREARLRAELMEQNAAHLAAATTVAEVAASTVGELEAFGAAVVFVWRLAGESVLEVLASTSVPRPTRRRFARYPLEREGLVTDALRAGTLTEVGTAEEYDARYPELADERLRLGFESLVAVPLRDARSNVVGALFAASTTRHWLDEDRRQLLLGMAEQTGVALERATLFESEREGRRLAELLEENAAHLAAAVTLRDIAVSTVTDLERAGIGTAAVHLLRPQGIEILAASGIDQETIDRFRLYSVDSNTLGADALRTGMAIQIESGREFDERYPESAEFRRAVGAESMLAVPLRASDRRTIGILGVSSRERRWLAPARRQVIFGIAEQCGLALERAELQAEAARNATTAEFLAGLAEALERATTVTSRARRLVEALTEERATFAAVHLSSDEAAHELVATSGSRPIEIDDDALWSRRVEQSITAGEVVSLDRTAEAGTPGAATPSAFILPLRARGHSIGALTLRAAADSDWQPAITPGLAREIASRAGVALDNALLYERERDVSHSLQLGLLGGALPAFEGVVVTAAYRPGTEALEVGGDWYDAFRLPSGAIALVVGDVVGHGLEAAVAMGQLRGAVSALAQSASPAGMLEQLDAFVENVPVAATATLAYVELDPVSGSMCYACAGHPPPLVLSGDGTTRYLWDGRSAPLGSMLGARRGEAEDLLGDGETLVLYTDGLVERRSEGLDAGFERLAETGARLAQAGAGLADDISDALLEGESQDDDVCVLTVHRIAVERAFVHSLTAAPSELAALRSHLRTWLEAHAVDVDTIRGVILAVSEAAANSIEHGYGSDGVGIVTVRAQLDDDRVEVSVHDEGTWHERDGRAAKNGDSDRGRGLRIVEALVDDVSIERTNGATVVRMTRKARDMA